MQCNNSAILRNKKIQTLHIGACPAHSISSGLDMRPHHPSYDKSYRTTNVCVNRKARHYFFYDGNRISVIEKYHIYEWIYIYERERERERAREWARACMDWSLNLIIRLPWTTKNTASQRTGNFGWHYDNRQHQTPRSASSSCRILNMAFVCVKVNLMINDDSHLAQKNWTSNRSHLRLDQSGMFHYASDDRGLITQDTWQSPAIAVKLVVTIDNKWHLTIQVLLVFCLRRTQVVTTINLLIKQLTWGQRLYGQHHIPAVW